MATTINVLCYRSKTLKNGEHPLMLCICKDRARKYTSLNLSVKAEHWNFSCHSLRKTFGRQVYNMNSENSELALVKLMELFNHSSLAITKRYLGLRQEEILQTYDCLTF